MIYIIDVYNFLMKAVINFVSLASKLLLKPKILYFSFSMKVRLLFILCFSVTTIDLCLAQKSVPKVTDSLSQNLYGKGTQLVDQCTPWHHLKCVYITGVEVYEDGSEGRSTRHWWRMSYIGRACSDAHGPVFGKIFEAVFAIPHYIGVAIGNGIGFMVCVVRGSPEKIAARKAKRKSRRAEPDSLKNSQ